jgi:ABC-2 type transport system ATP-binding protein
MVLDDVSLTVPRGRIVVLAGPNGAGKTSLMRAVTGRLRVDRGAIRVDGRPLVEAGRLGRVGLVPQDIALYPHLTVRENLAVLGRLAGLSPRDLRHRVDQGLAWAGLDDRASSFVRALSGGMRRRVNLVAGVLHRPALVLLDEPTVGVDTESRQRLHALLAAQRGEGAGLLVATHELDEAASFCDDVVLMDRGRVTATGSVGDIVARAFAGGRELMIAVEGADPSAASENLTTEGFRQIAPRMWVRAEREGLGSLGMIERRLAASGVRVSEARLRQPGLRAAVALLAGSQERPS